MSETNHESNPLKAVAAIVCIWIAAITLLAFVSSCGVVDIARRGL